MNFTILGASLYNRLNPDVIPTLQPHELPPGPPDSERFFFDLASKVASDPQHPSVYALGDQVSLNPQPLPPEAADPDSRMQVLRGSETSPYSITPLEWFAGPSW
jgi:hypothetical protein